MTWRNADVVTVSYWTLAFFYKLLNSYIASCVNDTQTTLIKRCVSNMQIRIQRLVASIPRIGRNYQRQTLLDIKDYLKYLLYFAFVKHVLKNMIFIILVNLLKTTKPASDNYYWCQRLHGLCQKIRARVKH